jgi:hypothetical protein
MAQHTHWLCSGKAEDKRVYRNEDKRLHAHVQHKCYSMWSGLQAGWCWAQPVFLHHRCKHRSWLLLGEETSQLIGRTDVFNINMLLLAPLFEV